MEKELKEIAYELRQLNKNFAKMLEKVKKANKKAGEILFLHEIGSVGDNQTNSEK